MLNLIALALLLSGPPRAADPEPAPHQPAVRPPGVVTGGAESPPAPLPASGCACGANCPCAVQAAAYRPRNVAERAPTAAIAQHPRDMPPPPPPPRPGKHVRVTPVDDGPDPDAAGQPMYRMRDARGRWYQHPSKTYLELWMGTHNANLPPGVSYRAPAPALYSVPVYRTLPSYGGFIGASGNFGMTFGGSRCGPSGCR